MEVKVKVREDAAAEEEDEQPVSAVQRSAVQSIQSKIRSKPL